MLGRAKTLTKDEGKIIISVNLRYMGAKQEMRYSNLHAHTLFSDGKQTPEENVRAAIEKNMSAIGISDHSYTAFDLCFCIPENKIEEYFREMRRLKEKYRAQIPVFVGAEYDVFSKLPKREDYDYIIGSCHYLKTSGGYRWVDHSSQVQKETIEEFFGGDSVAYAKAYFQTYEEGIRRLRPDILGHFDLTVKFGHIDEENTQYKNAALETLLSVLQVTPIIELNTGAICRGYRTSPYPAPYLIDEAQKHGGKFLLSSDSHDCANLTYWFDEAVALLKSRGVKSVVELTPTGFEEKGI